MGRIRLLKMCNLVKCSTRKSLVSNCSNHNFTTYHINYILFIFIDFNQFAHSLYMATKIVPKMQGDAADVLCFFLTIPNNIDTIRAKNALL